MSIYQQLKNIVSPPPAVTPSTQRDEVKLEDLGITAKSLSTTVKLSAVMPLETGETAFSALEAKNPGKRFDLKSLDARAHSRARKPEQIEKARNKIAVYTAQLADLTNLLGQDMDARKIHAQMNLTKVLTMEKERVPRQKVHDTINPKKVHDTINPKKPSQVHDTINPKKKKKRKQSKREEDDDAKLIKRLKSLDTPNTKHLPFKTMKPGCYKDVEDVESASESDSDELSDEVQE